MDISPEKVAQNVINALLGTAQNPSATEGDLLRILSGNRLDPETRELVANAVATTTASIGDELRLTACEVQDACR